MKKRTRKIISVVLFVLLNAAVISMTAFSEFHNSEGAAEIEEIRLRWWFLVPAVAVFVVAILANVYKYVLMIRNADTAGNLKKREIWKLAWRVVMLGKYYDNVTPAAVGGQPFQIYYMRKNSRLPKGQMTSIPIVGMIAGQIGFLVVAVICFIFGGVQETNPALFVTAWLGLLFFAFWPVLVFGINFFPKPTTRFIKFVVKILAKMRIIKNREKALEKVEEEVREYVKSVNTILKTKGLFFKVVVLSTLFQILTMAIPFFVLTAFGGEMTFIKCFVLTVAVTSAVYFVPTPGNSGAAEGTFFVVFSALTRGYVFWAMLIWRFFSYYIYIIVGLLIYLKMQIEKKKQF